MGHDVVVLVRKDDAEHWATALRGVDEAGDVSVRKEVGDDVAVTEGLTVLHARAHLVEERTHVVEGLEGQRDLEVRMTDAVHAVSVGVESRWRLGIALADHVDVESMLGQLPGFPDLVLDGILARGAFASCGVLCLLRGLFAGLLH